nr:unnamed protein product [Digitaria exilis]
MGDGECTKAVSLLFRIAALGLSVAAAVVMATATQLVIVGGDRGSSSTSSYTISYSHYSALTYFVAATAISAVCTAAALYLYGVRAAAGNGWLPVMTLMDAAAQGFLFSAAGAAFAARGVIGGGVAAPWGGSGTAIDSVCDAAGAFCGKVSVAAAVCALAAVAVAVAALAGDARRGSSSSRGSCCDW